MIRMRFESFSYVSSADGTRPLVADVAFAADGRPKPLLIVMHGYGGTRKDVTRDLEELSARGVVAVAPDMRGRGDSAGRWDSGGLDVHDILDATLAAVSRYPAEIDARNLNIVGYSGGGGNAIACMVRFPDLFQTAVSFFGIADYAFWHRSAGRPDCNAQMEAALGGPPAALPDIYDARNFIAAAGNAACSRLHFFWDVEETMCPPAMVEAFLAGYHAAGHANDTVHVSRPGDAKRWIHNWRTRNPDLSAADDLFLPDVLTRKIAAPRLPPRGRLIVSGYLVTRNFQVWLGDGQRGRAAIAYDLSHDPPAIQVVDNPSGWPVRVDRTSPLAALPE